MSGQESLLRRLLTALAGHEPRRITVVGNAPLSVSGNRAARIDAADLVVRMTSFAVDTDVPRIGRRTDVVVLHRGVVAGPSTFADSSRRIYLLSEPGRLYWEREPLPRWWPRGIRLLPISNRDFTAPLRREMGLGRFDVAWPTTGTLAAHVVATVFPQATIELTGTSLLGPPAGAGAQQRTFAHHWGESVTVTPEHRLDRERMLLQKWVGDGRIEVLV